MTLGTSRLLVPVGRRDEPSLGGLTHHGAHRTRFMGAHVWIESSPHLVSREPLTLTGKRVQDRHDVSLPRPISVHLNSCQSLIALGDPIGDPGTSA